MTQTIEAVYEHGVFRPLQGPAPSLAEGQQVRILVETEGDDDILALAARVYEGLTEADVEDVERIALDRTQFFTRTTP